MIYYLIALIVIAVDQLTKWAVVKYMDLYESIPIVEGWLHITSSRNRGAAFGILQDKRIFFVSLTIFVVVFLVYYMFKLYKTHRFYTFALALVLGGSIGNLIDRIRIGEVIDFIDVRIINFAIFNVADSAIVIGVGLLMLELFISKDYQKLD